MTLIDGEIAMMLGPSGSGKTTLLRLIGGLLRPTQGTIRLNEQEIHGPGRDRRIVFQENSCYPWLSVEANIAFGLSRPEEKEKVTEIMQMVGLSSVSHLFPRELSVGMRQRVGLARALIGGSKVLLLDEPLSSLDALTRSQLQSELRRLLVVPGRVVLWITHDIEEALLMGDRIFVIGSRPAKILFESRPGFGNSKVEDVRFTPRFESAYRELHREVRKVWTTS